MAYCTNCGNKLGVGFEYCPECGAKVTPEPTPESTPKSTYTFSFSSSEATKVCPKCGERMPDDVSYCLNCGTTFNEDDYDEDDEEDEDFAQVQKRVKYQFGTWRNKWVALFLCLFLGWFGVHKYYEGKVGMGLLYTFTFGLFCIGWFVDILVLLFKPNPYMAKRM